VNRNFDEILRVIDALQVTDGTAVSPPVVLTPGERVIFRRCCRPRTRERFGDIEEFTPYLR